MVQVNLQTRHIKRIFKLSASLLLCFGAINKGYLNTSTVIQVSGSDNGDADYVTNRWDALDKGMVHILGGQGKTAQDFIRLLRTVYNLKLMNCLFLQFSTYCFWTTVDCR